MVASVKYLGRAPAWLKELGGAWQGRAGSPGGEPLSSLAALWVGCRRLPEATQCDAFAHSLLRSEGPRDRAAASSTVSGSRLQPSQRAAKLESGSPPGLPPPPSS